MPEAQVFTDLQSAAKRVFVRANGGLVAARTGVVNDAVLNFLTAPTITGSVDLVTAANSANNGTSVVLRAPGIYSAELYVEILADALIPVLGISQDVAAAGLIGAASFGIAGFLDVQIPVIAVASVAGSTWPVKLYTEFEVTDVQARQDISNIIGSTIRFHASTAAGATPGVGLAQTPPYWRIRRIRDAYAA